MQEPGLRRAPSRSTRLLAALALVVGLAAASAAATVVQAGDLIVEVVARVKASGERPGRPASAALDFRAELQTVSGAPPPSVVHFEAELDHRVKLTNVGLPSCDPTRIASADVAAARAACASAIVGRGELRGTVVRPGEAAIPIDSAVTAFNGPPQGLTAVVLIHAQLAIPAATTYVVPVLFNAIRAGRYRLRVEADPPAIAEGHATISHFRLRLRRSYRLLGQRVSVISARCGEHDLLARGSASFSDGSLVSGLFVVPCR